jgi:hypothetical protein
MNDEINVIKKKKHLKIDRDFKKTEDYWCKMGI